MVLFVKSKVAGWAQLLRDTLPNFYIGLAAEQKYKPGPLSPLFQKLYKIVRLSEGILAELRRLIQHIKARKLRAPQKYLQLVGQ